MAEITAEQLAEFKRRKANPVTTVEERESYNAPKLTKKQIKSFLDATSEDKLNGDG